MKRDSTVIQLVNKTKIKITSDTHINITLNKEKSYEIKHARFIGIDQQGTHIVVIKDGLRHIPIKDIVTITCPNGSCNVIKI